MLQFTQLFFGKWCNFTKNLFLTISPRKISCYNLKVS
jgi:hypothetical protein